MTLKTCMVTMRVTALSHEDVRGRLTFNEPKNFCFLGYATGVMAPFLKDASGAAGWQCSLHVLQARALCIACHEADLHTPRVTCNPTRMLGMSSGCQRRQGCSASLMCVPGSSCSVMVSNHC